MELNLRHGDVIMNSAPDNGRVTCDVLCRVGSIGWRSPSRRGAFHPSSEKIYSGHAQRNEAQTTWFQHERIGESYYNEKLQKHNTLTRV